MRAGLKVCAVSMTQAPNRVRELRLAAGRRGWTQEKLAREAHVNAATISRIEGGKYRPSPLVAYRIAKAFGLTVEEVFPPEDQEAAV